MLCKPCILSLFPNSFNQFNKLQNLNILASLHSRTSWSCIYLVTQALIQKVLSWGVQKFRFFFFALVINDHILQRRKRVHINILSAPPSAHQRNAILMVFRWWAHDGTWWWCDFPRGDPGKSVVRLVDRPALTIAFDLGRKATKPTNQPRGDPDLLAPACYQLHRQGFSWWDQYNILLPYST